MNSIIKFLLLLQLAYSTFANVELYEDFKTFKTDHHDKSVVTYASELGVKNFGQQFQDYLVILLACFSIFTIHDKFIE